MKKDWKLYDRLVRLETGIGGTRSLIDASPEWWEEKIKVDKEFAKFKDTNLDIYETYYAPLFRDCVAVGDQTMTPVQFQNNSNPDDVPREEYIEGMGDGINFGDGMHFGDEEPLFPTIVESSLGKRKKSKNVINRSTKSKISNIEDKLDVAVDVFTTKYSSNSQSPTI
ncbi:uncharacterized protein LOC143632572 [Bidens hawaiensis]|uniref:uncharacterized protein LOC143632572 n=1 Tax=Bidens hawaiensis TaxID=980011 RepID=UPI00404B54EA